MTASPQTQPPGTVKHPEGKADANAQSSQPIRLEGFASQDLYRRREKIFTRSIKGRFQRLRALSGWPLLLGYFATPWLTHNSQQAVLFDLPARQFRIFDLTLWPQDLWLLGWLLMIAAFALFTFTNIVGRLWCGYTCPQTVWTAIYMWVEQLAEGSRHQRMRLDQAPWSLNKLRKRLLKHGIWLSIAALTGITFVGYFAPIRLLTSDIVGMNPALIRDWSLFACGFFTLATYINAGWMREQVCLYMCPYARFQSAMIDADTLVVSFDHHRGEPRGSAKRKLSSDLTSAGKGDCIDCTMCVQVCPTGIDIRDGLQYECIGCAHCIDACNQVMQQVGRAPNLIGYSSQRELEGGKTRLLRPRSIGYATITALLSIAFGLAVYYRAPITIDIVRERGELYQIDTNHTVHNEYQVILVNRSSTIRHIRLGIESDTVLHVSPIRALELGSGGRINVQTRLTGPVDSAPVTMLHITACDHSYCAREPTTFFGPGGPLASNSDLSSPTHHSSLLPAVRSAL